MMLKRISILFLLLLLLSSAVWAEEGDGGYAGAYLQVPIGARPTAMGGAYLAIADDGAGPLYNPAGVAGLKSIMFASSYRTLGLDRSLGYVTFLYPAKERAVIGVNWLYAGSGSVATRNKDGDLLGQEISNNSHNIGILFAKQFQNTFSAGIKLNYLQASLDDLTAFSVGVDFGLMIHVSQFLDRERRDLVPVQNIQIGLTLKNIGAKYRWDTGDISGNSLGVIQEDQFPVEFGLGLSARFLDRKLILSVDGTKNTEQSFELRSGAEYFLYPEFALRSGYSDGRFAAGTGYVISVGERAIAVDYAFSTDKVGEGSEHIFSFDFLF